MKKVDYYIPLYKDKIYHIYNRGNGNDKIFYNEENYYYFLRQYYNYLYNYLETFAYTQSFSFTYKGKERYTRNYE